MEFSKLLINEPPLQVLPSLAKRLDINKAVILQQVHYWLMASGHEIEGHLWVYNSYGEWSQQFPWLSERAVRWHIKGLEEAGYLVAGDFNNDPRDNTKWYRINYEALEALSEPTGLEPQSGEESPTEPTGGVATSDTPPYQNRPVQVAESDAPSFCTETTPTDSSQKSPRKKGAKAAERESQVHDIFKAMHDYLGYPEKVAKDPIPNYGQEGTAVKRLLMRGYAPEEILAYWRGRVDKAGGFVTMVYVNKDIGAPARGNGSKPARGRVPSEAELERQARAKGIEL